MNRHLKALLLGVALTSIAPLIHAITVVEESAKLVIPDPKFTSIASVAIDGDVAVVSSVQTTQTAGVWAVGAFLFERSGSSWSFRTTLLNTQQSGDLVPPRVRVAVKGGVAAISTSTSQQILIYERSASTWSLTSALIVPPTTKLVGDVEIDSGTIFAAGYRRDGVQLFTGTAIRKDASGQWAIVQTVRADDNNAWEGSNDGDVAIAGNLLAVGSPGMSTPETAGEVWLFNGSPGAWSPVKQFRDEMPSPTFWFGMRIALDNVALLVRREPTRGVNVFTTSTGWTFDGSLRAPDALMHPNPNGWVGGGLDTDGGVAVDGVMTDSNRGSSAGSVLIYRTEEGLDRTPVARLFASDATPNLWLGESAAISGNRVVAGSRTHAAYVFDLPNLNSLPSEPPTLEETFELDQGGHWTPFAGSNFSVVTSGTTRVYRQSSLTGDAGATLANSSRTNQSIQADIAPLAIDGADRWFGLMTRYVDPNNYYYVTVRSSNVVQIRRMLNGTFTTLASAPLPFVLNKTYRVRFEAIGKFLQVYVNGTRVLTVRDASLSQGLAGIRMYKTRADYDNVVVSPNPAIALYATNFSVGPDPGVWTQITGSWFYDQPNGLYGQSSLDGGALSVTGLTDAGVLGGSVQVRAKALEFNGADRWFGPVINYSGNHYFYMTVRSSNVVSLRENFNDQFTILDEAPLPVSTNTWYDLRLELVGNSLRGYVNGKLMVEKFVGVTGGQFGVAMYKTRALFDDFSAVTY